MSKDLTGCKTSGGSYTGQVLFNRFIILSYTYTRWGLHDRQKAGQTYNNPAPPHLSIHRNYDFHSQ